MIDEQKRVLDQNQDRWAETVMTDADLRAGSHPLSAMNGIGVDGVARGAAGSSSGLMVHFADVPKPVAGAGGILGRRSICIETPGFYVLSHGPGILHSIVHTKGLSGSLELYDVGYVPDLDPKEPMEYKITSKIPARKLYSANPPIFYPTYLDIFFQEGLLARVECMQSQALVMTIVWS